MISPPLSDDVLWGVAGARIAPAIPGIETAAATSLLDLLRAGAGHDPDSIALVGQNAILSYRDLLRLAQNAARVVAAHVGHGQTVACLLPATPDGIAGLLGCMISGRLTIVLDPTDPPERLRTLLFDAAPAASMLAEPLLFPDSTPVLTLRDALAGRGAERHPVSDGQHDPDAPLAVYYTSGSSGQPKGIVLSSRSMLHLAFSRAHSQKLTPSDCLFHAAAPRTAHGFACLLSGLFRGARVLLATVATEGAGAVLRLFERERVTYARMPPPVMRLFSQLKQAQSAFGALRAVGIGTIALPRADVDHWRRVLPPGCDILHAYGSTEAQLIAEWILPATDEGGEPTAAAGLLQPFHDYALLDQDDRPALFGTPGELVLRSRYVASGEWQGGQLVSGRLQPVSHRPGWRIFRTGDLAQIQPDGLLRVLGRVDRQVKINSIRVEPAEIEAVLRQEPTVTDAAVIATTANGRVTLHGFVASATPDREALTEQLRQRVATALPMSFRPTRLTVLDRLPLLPAGKTDLMALTELAKSRGFHRG